MPATKNQGLRLEYLDQLLSGQKLTVDQLLSKINNQLGEEKPITKRTLFRDIDDLIKEKDAPIHRPNKKDNRYYYTERFSIKNIPLDEEDLGTLKQAVQILKQVENFTLLKDVEDVIQKLENRIQTPSATEAILLQFEKHTTADGTQYINDLLTSTKDKNTLRISYQPYTHKQATEYIVHPYLLKEFRNRWFLLGREGNTTRVTIYGLDRIKKIRNSNVDFIENDLFNPDDYFKYLIGVSVSPDSKPEIVEIKVNKQQAPYILSKPIHSNQEKIKEYKNGNILIRLKLIINYELKSVLLSYNKGIKITKPKGLVSEMKLLISEMKQLYNVE
ncbi:MAG TPA: WYL domain-containing protein [Cyclobacteriaceae bacterium]|nr:WYL domain-containing protein [Cyclobacteriaceae bacterium]HMV88972.1 WYL domain-containing protein [Cyclobacteriaceae bacterium]HNC10420.1 WYL domain-containing protein [Cyclobacteriaceae bacterium]HNC29401.1 WYL domain-containing protein [Cyclobacteriaceae bacterium]HND43037.1 WYL domain-containing protein [Cyclobacteriaceae bacterium]